MLCCTHCCLPLSPHGLQGIEKVFSKGDIFLGAKGKIKQGVQMRFLSRLDSEFRLESETYYVISGCRCMNIITPLHSVIYVLLCDTEQPLSVTVLDGSLYVSDSKSCCQLCFIPSVILCRCLSHFKGIFLVWAERDFAHKTAAFSVWSGILSWAECWSLWSAGNPRSWCWCFLVH